MVLAAAVALGGCGVETASTAATAASLKAKESSDAKKTVDDVLPSQAGEAPVELVVRLKRR